MTCRRSIVTKLDKKQTEVEKKMVDYFIIVRNKKKKVQTYVTSIDELTCFDSIDFSFTRSI